MTSTEAPELIRPEVRRLGAEEVQELRAQIFAPEAQENVEPEEKSDEPPSKMQKFDGPKGLPQKKYYRQRAHSNPHSDHDIDYPRNPAEMDWHKYYGDYSNGRKVEFADIGCGYGGLLFKLSPMFPESLMLGIELRVKVSDFVMDKIAALRLQALEAGDTGVGFKNLACIRSNAMKYLPNYFTKGQLNKMFFLYPDPHFKKRKHKWRIITREMLGEYAYVLRPGGIIYTISDVEELSQWMVKELSRHPLFERLTDEEEKADPVTALIYESTEEGQKVTRNKGDKFAAVFRRLPDPEPAEQ